ncbi:hypothetical protein [Pantoea stewartii]|uniref:hypothetical protein n=1 Tax=Pantoea stewartii TaxID=66269 RepID=UPI0019808309|nr:hypothetical protein [Pantoea stewartii]
MNYEKMSGYEINNRIHNIVACGNKFDLKVEGYKVTWTDKKTGEVFQTLGKQYDMHFKDYLSSWEYTGPILMEYRIDLEWGYNKSTDLDDCVAASALQRDTGRVCNFSTVNQPLRAALIVLLKMHEAQNE